MTSFNTFPYSIRHHVQHPQISMAKNPGLALKPSLFPLCLAPISPIPHCLWPKVPGTVASKEVASLTTSVRAAARPLVSWTSTTPRHARRFQTRDGEGGWGGGKMPFEDRQPHTRTTRGGGRPPTFDAGRDGTRGSGLRYCLLASLPPSVMGWCWSAAILGIEAKLLIWCREMSWLGKEEPFCSCACWGCLAAAGKGSYWK